VQGVFDRVVAYQSPTEFFVGSLALLQGPRAEIAPLFEAVKIAVEFVLSTPSATCTLGFLTDDETEVKLALKPLADMLAMFVDTKEMPPRFMHSVKRVMLCYRLKHVATR
jgi:hypothetical protein